MNTLNSIINVNSIMGEQMIKCLFISCVTYVKAIFLCFVNILSFWGNDGTFPKFCVIHASVRLECYWLKRNYFE